jgi:hypothetical protein
VDALILAHAASTLAMAGLAWFVQVVHYPLFALVGGDFPTYEAAHADRTALVVGPLMGVEALTAVALVIARPGLLTGAGCALVAALWVSTAAVQVPCHRRLARGFDADVHRRLVASSWFRTGAWSARSAIALALV